MSPAPDNSKNMGVITGLRLPDEELVEILDRLDNDPGDSSTVGTIGREYPYRQKNLLVSLYPENASQATLRVPTRTISRNGLSFLHLSYVYPGTKCSVQLLSTHNMWYTVEGTVHGCRYVDGHVHEVRLRFYHEIQVAIFARQAVRRKILVADDEATSHNIISYYLEQLNCDVTVVEDGKQALQAAAETKYDLVLLDLDMPVMDGYQALSELRSRDYEGFIAAVTSRTRPEDESKCRDAGFNRYVAKPVAKQDLLDLIDSLDTELLFSSLAGDPGMDKLIDLFVSELNARAIELEQAHAVQDFDTLERLARSLKGSAASYGFEPISDTAAELENVTAQADDLEKIRKLTKELVTLCSVARASIG